MKQSFRKFKYTHHLFSKKLPYPATVEQLEDRFIIGIPISIFDRDETYIIKSVNEQNMGTKVYRVCKVDMTQDEESIKQAIEYEFDLFFIQTTKFGNVLSIYDKNNVGIILKR